MYDISAYRGWTLGSGKDTAEPTPAIVSHLSVVHVWLKGRVLTNLLQPHRKPSQKIPPGGVGPQWSPLDHQQISVWLMHTTWPLPSPAHSMWWACSTKHKQSWSVCSPAESPWPVFNMEHIHHQSKLTNALVLISFLLQLYHASASSRATDVYVDRLRGPDLLHIPSRAVRSHATVTVLIGTGNADASEAVWLSYHELLLLQMASLIVGDFQLGATVQRQPKGLRLSYKCDLISH